MSNNKSAMIHNVKSLSETAHLDFYHLGDYIWKSVKLIDHERKIELKKLRAYYPDDPEMKKIRWERESHRLDSTFPFLIAQGNFLNVMAMFEIYVLLLAKNVETVSSKQVADVKGQGITRALNFLKITGVPFMNIQNWEQVSIALTFRNCIIHASGALVYSRKGSQIRNIVNNKRFFSSDVLKRHRERGEDITAVSLGVHPVLGERLVIANDYSHWVTSILRQFFVDLCSEVLAQHDGD